jgi:putative membrane-bound dehydrogenase-like protein
MRYFTLFFAYAMLFVIVTNGFAQDQSQEIPNTQELSIPFTPPHKALEMMEVPEGFEVTLFAHEPDVHQPIAMTFDAKGRLWVVENYTYADRNVNFNEDLNDRVVIFEDVDNDGKFDKRKVFWDKGKKLTGIELGRGGVWLTAAPQLIFIPDADRDDVPDGPPKVILDGFEDDTIRHNFVNGLRWGPDGWLYSRHGIQAVSYVGKPGEPKSKRTPMNCCVWRYHPERDVFEIVAEGGTNFWGLDFDENGELFVINTVIGHLFHIVPGARYNRMHGSHFNPYTFQTIDQTADHVHWDRSEKWWDAKNSMKDAGNVSGGTDKAGGGHAHSGLMIYQGDNWPDEFRGRAFTLNFHGRRMNQEIIEREGNSYVAKHAPDMFRTSDPWFRGVELTYGPDGAVYVLDWSDIGECHENDGVHRTSGRIFKISYGKPMKPEFEDLCDLPDEKLVELLEHKNAWYPRMAQRILLDRFVKDSAKLPDWLVEMAANAEGSKKQMLAVLQLAACFSESDGDLLLGFSASEHEHVRSAWVRLMADRPVDLHMTAVRIANKAEDPSPLVRLCVASALDRLPGSFPFTAASRLVKFEEDMGDRVQPKLIWHRIEPLIVENFELSMKLFAESKSQLLRRNIARRLACDPDRQREMLEKLSQLVLSGTQPHVSDVLNGISQALEGRRQMTAPKSWASVVERASEFGDDAAKLIEEISPVFGDGLSIERLKKLAVNKKADASARQQAILSLGQYADAADLFPLLKDEIKDRMVSSAVVKTLAACNEAEVAPTILNQYKWLPIDARENAMDTLCSRKPWTKKLLGAIESGRVSASMLTAWHARQIQLFEDDQLTERLAKVWGKVRDTDAKKLEQIEKLREMMSAERVAASDAEKGKALFSKHCASCHAMFGEGKSIGPDLTGADRKNLNYLLENIVDPSASVATTYRTSVLAMEDGRLMTGVVMDNDGQTLKLQTQEALVTLEVDTVEDIKQTELSLMPDGLLDKLTDEEKVDLFGYLMSK